MRLKHRLHFFFLAFVSFHIANIERQIPLYVRVRKEKLDIFFHGEVLAVLSRNVKSRRSKKQDLGTKLFQDESLPLYNQFQRFRHRIWMKNLDGTNLDFSPLSSMPCRLDMVVRRAALSWQRPVLVVK